MDDWIRLVMEGGAVGKVLFVLGALGILASALGAVVGVASRRGALAAGLVLASGAAVLLALAAVGVRLNLRTMEEAIVNVNPPDREIIRLEGRAETRSLWILGFAFAAVPLATAAFLFGKFASDQTGGRAQLLAGGLLAGLGILGMGGTAAIHQNTLRRTEEALASVDPSELPRLLRELPQVDRRLLWGPGVGSAGVLGLGVILFIAGLGGAPTPRSPDGSA